MNYTHKCLDRIFESSKVIKFNVDSKFIIFGDCHRGENTWADDFANNQMLFFHALNHYDDKKFTYIEVGDGDELWENKEFAAIRSAHSHIFWVMSKFYSKDPTINRLHLIWGNHDIVKKDKEFVKKNLFHFEDERTGEIKPFFDGIEVHEALILQNEDSGKKIFLIHGHQGGFFCDRVWWIGRFFVRHLWRHLQVFGVKDPTSPAKNFKKKIKIESRLMDWAKSRNQMIVMGHTHRPWFVSNDDDPPYFNVGSCVHPRCITGIEIQNSAVSLIKWWLAANKKGAIYVEREILAGPRDL